MTTLRDYLVSGNSRFASSNHPIPQTSGEVLQRLEGDEQATGMEVLGRPIEIEEIPGGGRLIYLLPREPGQDPFLIELAASAI